MGIDGIGKPGGVGGPSGAGPAAPAAPVRGESFSVEGPAAPAAAGPSAELSRLQRGEITLDQYLDARVDQGVAHLSGRLGSEQLSFIRDTLRSQLTTDPTLVELVRRATGQLPTPSADGE